MPIGKITKISKNQEIAVIDSKDRIVYIDLKELPLGYHVGNQVEYELRKDVDGKQIQFNVQLIPSPLSDWYKSRRRS